MPQLEESSDPVTSPQLLEAEVVPPAEKKKRVIWKQRRGPKKKRGRKKKPNPVGRPKKPIPPGRKPAPPKMGRPVGTTKVAITTKLSRKFNRETKLAILEECKNMDNMSDEQINALVAERLKIERDKIANAKKSQRLTTAPPKSTAFYVSYQEAKEYVQQEMLTSMHKFREWHKLTKPRSIPSFPYRYYKDEWKGWNDFLGTNNVFGGQVGVKPKIWRAYLEALAFAHSLRLANDKDDWLVACKDGRIPDDIPPRPDLYYPEWKGWKHWCGTRVIDIIEAKKEIDRSIQIYFIIHEPGVPTNVLTFGIEPMGISGMKQRWDSHPFQTIKAFWYDPEKDEMIRRIVSSLSSPYSGSEHQRIVSNVWEIVYYLEQQLAIVKT